MKTTAGRGALALAVLLGLAVAVVTRPAKAVSPGGPQIAHQSGASHGYWQVGADGGVFGFGDAAYLGGMGGRPLNQPIVGMASTPSGKGYWLVARDGGVFNYGDAGFFGSTGGMHLNQPIVGMAAAPGGRGYWLVAADGGIFNFGEAPFLGSAGSLRLARPVVGMAATPSGRGYWLVASDGGIFSYGDAVFRGSAGAIKLAQPVVGMAPTPSGHGYWLTAADGGIFSYGDAPYLGSTGGIPLAQPVVGIQVTPRGLGYWLVARDGGVFRFGDAGFDGSAAAYHPSAPVVGMAPVNVQLLPEVAMFFYPWYATPDDGGGVWRHWEANGHNPPDDIASNDYPARGVYSDANAALLDAQLAEISRAGVDEIISSWWGSGSYENQVLPLVAQAAADHGVRLAVQIEPYAGRTVDSVRNDVQALHNSLGIRDFYIYLADFAPASAWSDASYTLGDVRLFGESGSLASMTNGAFATYARAARFDGVYTYDPVRYGRGEFAAACGEAREVRVACAPSVAPGYVAWRTKPNDTRVVNRDGGARYDAQWTDAVDVGADIITITSYNEWHEGSEIEPATPHCGPDGYCSNGFEFAYGRTGAAATTAYLDRTGMWAGWFRSLRPHP